MIIFFYSTAFIIYHNFCSFNRVFFKLHAIAERVGAPRKASPERQFENPPEAREKC